MTDVTTKLDEIGERLGTLDSRTRELEEVDEHVQSLKDAARQADQTSADATGPEGELTKHREAIEHLSAQARQTHASLGALKIEHAALGNCEASCARRTPRSSSQSTTPPRSRASSRDSRDCDGTDRRLRPARRHVTAAREDTAAAMTAIKDVEKKLGPLAQLQELGQNTDERLVTLNALAERVSLKAKAIEGQQPDRRARPRSIQPCERDGLVDGGADRQVERGHEACGDRRRDPGAARDVLFRHDRAAGGRARLHEETEQQTVSLEKRSALLVESMHAQVGTLEVDKKEVDAVGERLRALVGAIGRAETRMNGLAGHEKVLSTVSNGVRHSPGASRISSRSRKN